MIPEYMSRVDVEILTAFADGNMRITNAANTTSYDPRTIRYHLERIKQYSGLDPFNFYELIKIIEMIGGGIDKH